VARVEKQSEQAAIDGVAERLKEKHPDLDAAHIDRLVKAEYDRMLSARLRDYIPVLVEHQVKQTIRHERQERV
jgi:hypothetical protein